MFQRVITIITMLLFFFLIANPECGAQEAFTHNRKPITQEENSAILLVNEAWDFFHAGKNAEFIATSTKAFAMAPELADVQASFGTAMALAGKYEEAREHLLKAISIEDDTPHVWTTLGAVYTSLGDNASALKCYDYFLKKYPADIAVTKIRVIAENVKSSMSQVANNGNSDYFAFACQNKYRWPAKMMPIKVYIDKTCTLGGYRENFPDIMRTAFQDWANASDGKITFSFTNESSNSNIKVSWYDQSDSLMKQCIEGQTQPYVTQGKLSSATIKLPTKSLASNPLSDAKLKELALHEIGHSLGIMGHSTSPQDVMYSSESASETEKKISSRDMATIARLYAETE